MKNIRNITFSILGLFAISACSSDWLDETSTLQIRAEKQFQTEEGFKDALIGVYISMTRPEMYSKDMTWYLVDLLSRQYADLPPLARYENIQQFNYATSRSTGQIDNIWQKSYNTIANINSALYYIDKNKEVLNPLNYSLIKGELLGLRAFIHFDLLRLFGLGNLTQRNLNSEFTIPYVTSNSKEITPSRPYGETFTLLQNDLNQAAELLKKDPIYIHNTNSSEHFSEVNREGFYDDREQRMNYYAVRALQARSLLWMGNDQEIDQAKIAALEVIEEAPFQLITSENYLVSNDPILYPEVLFTLNVNGLANLSNPLLNANSETNYDAVFISETDASEIYETQNVNVGIADVRYNTMLTSQTRGLVSIKLLQRNVTMHPNQVPLMKLAEMYYIMAEYFIGEQDTAQAVFYLNKVRSSRGILDELPITLTPEQLDEELQKEYRKEFISEGQLFFFYKRLGKTTIPGVPTTVEVNDNIYVLPLPDNELEFGS